ncbi:hypothetical protein F5I97DRAFT_999100 [Phlebopus sp. FC_14]|nr:hypothetical protein F5I97DRAFT_999100 [Phlebopus sp. FC_14]
MQRGIYTFVNRQSGTALELSNDNSLVCMPPSDSEAQKWEITPLGEGHTIRNVQTGVYLSVKSITGRTPVFGCQFPVAWSIKEVHVAAENVTLFEIRWPLTGFMFDLAECGSSAPCTKVQLMDSVIPPDTHRCRLWRPSRCFQDYCAGSIKTVAQERPETTHTAIDVADIPEGGELVLTTTTVTTIRKVARNGISDIVPSYSSSMIRD